MAQRRRERRWWWTTDVLLALITGGVLACSGVADDSKLPPDVQDPTVVQTPSGALARYRGALLQVAGMFDRVITASAIITDELAGLRTALHTTGAYTDADSRTDLSKLSDPNFDRLHRVRAQAREARGFLASYPPDSALALQGHLFAVEAYADVLLADLFCSGIPLSTVDFGANYTTTAGFTTAEVYRHAVTLFDSALAMTAGTADFQHLAAVGKGRALLALDQYAEAAAAVSAVPDDYSYSVVFTHPDFFGTLPDSAVLWYFDDWFRQEAGALSVADREGEHGLNYRSSGDPRILTMALGTGPLGDSMYFPVKYSEPGAATYVLANGIEARLIEAEAALHAGSGAWLAALNALRTDGTYDTQPDANDPSQTDTLSHAGTGGVAGLGTLADPSPEAPEGPTPARVDLVFRERAFWLFLTGHREGDLRRLVRNYGRRPQDVYPAGSNYPGGTGAYGSEIVIPTPVSERQLNPKYVGCFHRNA